MERISDGALNGTVRGRQCSVMKKDVSRDRRDSFRPGIYIVSDPSSFKVKENQGFKSTFAFVK